MIRKNRFKMAILKQPQVPVCVFETRYICGHFARCLQEGTLLKKTTVKESIWNVGVKNSWRHDPEALWVKEGIITN